jgi:hypothetical protein
LSILKPTPKIIPETTTLPITVIQKKKVDVERFIHKFKDIQPVTIPEDKIPKLNKYVNYYTRRYTDKTRYPNGIPAEVLQEVRYRYLKKSYTYVPTAVIYQSTKLDTMYKGLY